MKFKILSHAGMLVETDQVKLVTDPWILGSCYWRSWWNYPKAPAFPKDDITFIYLTHMHWDHFHGPSLRKFPPNVTYLVPKAPTPCIVNDLQDFPYKAIIELDHGKKVQLAPDLWVTSYHYGLNTDSALVIEDGRTVLLNMNDCKLAGRPLKQVLRRHPKIDFMLRSHSSAQPYPHCVDADDKEDLRYRSNEDYVADFVDSAALVKPRYAVPFASNNCFLHRETFQFNETVVSPLDVKTYFDSRKPPATECVIMVAGDSWNARTGFHLQEQDFFTAKEDHLRKYAEEVAPILDACYRREDQVKVSFAAFEKYFSEFLKNLPWFVRLVFKPVIVFEVLGQPQDHWVLDLKQKKIYSAKDGLPEYDLLFRAHPAVLRDCLQRKMFTLFFPSKRLHIEIKRGRVKEYFIFEQLFDLHEYGLLPLRNCFSRRSLSAWSRRWREVLYILESFVRVLTTRGDQEGISKLVPRTTL